METLRRVTEEFFHSVGLNPTTMYFGNSMLEYTIALATFLVTLILFKVFQWVALVQLKRIAEKTTTNLDDTMVKIVQSFTPPFYLFLAFWVALRPLEIVGFADKFITAVLIIWVVYQVVIAAGIFFEDIVFKKFARDRDPNTRSALQLLVNLGKGALWGLGVILMLSNLGVDVSSLLAGVGVMGIAIGFALQGILSDLFSSFSIYFDKPFKAGDFIVVGDHLGTVEQIGVKSTRLRALGGEELIISNQELTSARIQNFHDLAERRVVVHFGVLYETPAKKVRAIPKMVQDIVEGQESTRFDRTHFYNFGDSSLDFELVYYALTDDYGEHMDIEQEIFLQIFEAFEKEGIGFAYPTRTLYINNQTAEKK